MPTYLEPKGKVQNWQVHENGDRQMLTQDQKDEFHEKNGALPQEGLGAVYEKENAPMNQKLLLSQIKVKLKTTT